MDDDEKMELSSHALSALTEFYTERDAQAKRYEDLKAATEHHTKLSMTMFVEDWNVSQFWYTDETAELIARELLSDLDADTVSVSLSALHRGANDQATGHYGSPRVCLFEFDERFSVLEGFVKYDFNTPMFLPAEFKGQFDRFLCDPPFLKDDCHIKVATTARWLSKAPSRDSSSGSQARVAICTGANMAPIVYKVYPGVHRTSLEVKHGRNGLSNEYWCFANFECKDWMFVSPETSVSREWMDVPRAIEESPSFSGTRMR